MNENPPNNVVNSNSPLDEELVAYLDGELDVENARRIEALLASDPTVRRRLQSLERTWDLLDELDRAPLGEPFTQTTLEMVAIAAREDLAQTQAEAPRRRRRWLFGVLAGVLLAAAGGFVTVALHNPDRQLLVDLPLLENLDEYRQIGSIEFLRQLRDEKFPFTASAKSPETVEEPAATRRQRIEQMSLDAKERLARAEDSFAASSPEEQRRLRQLYKDICDDPDSQRLRAVMHAYYQWLKPLPAVMWAELAEGDTKERIALVKKRLQEQHREGGWLPDGKDMAVIHSWLDECATLHETDFKKSVLSNDQERERFTRAKKEMRHQMVLGYLRWQSQFGGRGKAPAMITAEDFSRLHEKLSPEAAERLDKKSSQQQWRQLASWMRQDFRRAMEERRGHGLLSQNDDERLAEFFEGLTVEQRDRLLAMPSEEMQWELQRLFQMRNRSGEGPGRHERRPGDFGRPGPGWPGGSQPTPPVPPTP